MTKNLKIDFVPFSFKPAAENKEKAAPSFVVFMDKNGQLCLPEQLPLKQDFLQELKEAYPFKQERFCSVDAFLSEGTLSKRFIIIQCGEWEKYQEDDFIRLGGAVYGALTQVKHAIIFLPLQIVNTKQNLHDFALGLHLRHYKFDKYFTKGDKEEAKVELESVILAVEHPEKLKAVLTEAEDMAQSVNFARNLVHEPANILGTESFAQKAKDLEALGLEVIILDEKQLKDIGMRALLGVAKGAKSPARVAVLKWQGAQQGEASIALVGKGVVFDSGGISLKPSLNMEDMKADMAGAAAVLGAMRLIAKRKLQKNVVALVGMVENMPGGNAMRPGDILTSLSGQTIEVVNTDAEGRLVLADLLTYAQENLQAKTIIDFATLTGAIAIALGNERAGLFSNDDNLAERLFTAGEKSGEKLWQLPLGKEYDKRINSKWADMRNSAGRLAGSITAAQFLKRFIGEDVSWAHLDIAAVAMDSPKNEYNHCWANGFGVRLVYHFLT